MSAMYKTPTGVFMPQGSSRIIAAEMKTCLDAPMTPWKSVRYVTNLPWFFVMDILGSYYRTLNRLIHCYVKLRYKNELSLGRNVLFYGYPLLRILPAAKITVGDNVNFVSAPSANLVGLSKRMSIVVLQKATLDIGNNTGFSGVSIVCYDSIAIGQYCNFGGNVWIWDTDFHSLDWQIRRKTSAGSNTKPIVIGDDVFVGANSIILKGVSIGDRSVIGAGSVVSRNIPADEVWAGNPARLIRKL